jgi:hypothetical protein
VKNTIILLTLLLAACSKDQETNDAATILSSGTWRVVHNMNATGDRTNDFLGYTITFTGNGIIAATRNNVTSQGTWSKIDASNQLVIDLGARTTGNQPLGNLSNTWKITALNSSEISLYDDADGEMLSLLKN